MASKKSGAKKKSDAKKGGGSRPKKSTPKAQSEVANARKRKANLSDTESTEPDAPKDRAPQPDDVKDDAATEAVDTRNDSSGQRWFILTAGESNQAIKASADEAEQVRREIAKRDRCIVKIRPALNDEKDRRLVMGAEGDPDELGPGPCPTSDKERLHLIEIKQRAILSIQARRDQLSGERKRLGKEIERIEEERDQLIWGQGALPFPANDPSDNAARAQQGATQAPQPGDGDSDAVDTDTAPESGPDADPEGDEDES